MENEYGNYDIITSSFSSGKNRLFIFVETDTFNPNHGVLNYIKNNISDLKNNFIYNLVTIGTLENIYLYESIQIFNMILKDSSSKEIKELHNQLQNIILMTYRSGFTPIYSSKSYFTSDCGWGCMIRVSQMLLATAIHFTLQKQKGNNQLLNKQLKSDKGKQELINKVILLFFDNQLLFENIKDIDVFQNVISKNLSNKEITKVEVPKNDTNLEEELKNYEIIKSETIIEVHSDIDLLEHVFLNKNTLEINEGDNKNKAEILDKLNSNNLLESDKKENTSFVLVDNSPQMNEVKKITPPFSIQNICNTGCNNHSCVTGEWYSDVASFNILKELADKSFPQNLMKLLYFQDGFINENEILKECFTKIECICLSRQIEKDGFECIEKASSLSDFEIEAIFKRKCRCFEGCLEIIENKESFYYKINRPGLICVSLRIGLDRIDPMYFERVFELFNIPGSLGFAGGMPRRALYFIGMIKKKNDKAKPRLLYLDPHQNQEAPTNIKELEELYYKTYIAKNIYSISISEISPSMTCGFYFTNLEEYESLKIKLEELSKDKESFLKLGKTILTPSITESNNLSFSSLK